MSKTSRIFPFFLRQFAEPSTIFHIGYIIVPFRISY